MEQDMKQNGAKNRAQNRENREENREQNGKQGHPGRVEYAVRPVPCSTRPLRFDEELCVGCNRCANVCQCDILLPSPEKGRPPVVMYPGECYYCGACVMVCPRPGAIRLIHPLMNQAKFVPVRGSGMKEQR